MARTFVVTSKQTDLQKKTKNDLQRVMSSLFIVLSTAVLPPSPNHPWQQSMPSQGSIPQSKNE